MVSVQRAFAHKLSTQQAADVRKQISYTTNVKGVGYKNEARAPVASISPCDIVDPLDYEDFIQQHQMLIDRHPLRSIIDFPPNDVQVFIEPRKLRTKRPILPKEPISELDPHVKDCIECYTHDWVVVEYCYRHHSTSSTLRDRPTEREILLQNIPRQEFELDINEQTLSDDDSTLRGGSETSSIARKSVASQNSAETHRSSWASFDLMNTMNDPLLLYLLQRSPQETVENEKQENRQEALMLLYPPSDIEDFVERRAHPEMPVESLTHRILVKFSQLKLELEVEPIFASIALYDCKERRKVSESFYFDLNSDDIRTMISPHVPYVDASTQSKGCIFNITYPSPDLFLVIKLEKVLQGDINDCIEPYMKEERNLEKIKTNALMSCERLGKYRMPFCWTPVYLMNVINGKNSLERDTNDKESSGSNSLDRKFSGSNLEQLRKKATEIGLTRRGSLERKSTSDKRSSWSSDDLTSNFDTFSPVTLKISHFFKQESDRLHDEDLYKFLQDFKRTNSYLKKFKSISGLLQLDISPCPEELKANCLTPELEPLMPYTDEKNKIIKEVLEFPSKEVYIPHYLYRNLLYVYPKELNFTGRAGSARNIAVKMEVLFGEDRQRILDVIYGKSSCPQFTSEVYAAVNYHNRCPCFQDEFKVQLPANLSDQHHLFFTFYHVSCQKKVENNCVETPVGYTWLPLLKDHRLQTGEFCLPVTVEYPPSNYSYISPDVLLPGIKWVDNHKSLFSVCVESVSSVHTGDPSLDQFFVYDSMLEHGSIPARLVNDTNIENEFKNRILNISQAKLEPLVKFLPLVLDKLLTLLVKPPILNNCVFNIGQAVFETIAVIVKLINTGLPESEQETAGWHSLLTTYTAYQCCIPNLVSKSCSLDSPLRKANSIHRSEVDGEIDMYTKKNFVRKIKPSGILNGGFNVSRSDAAKLLHEEIALQWVVTSGTAREYAVTNSWFFFDLMIKSMVEYMASVCGLDSSRKHRFSEQFLDDISTLVTTFTSDIISGYSKDIKLIQSMNCSLAFFLFDLLSIADRGFVFMLIKTYYKHMSTKISSLPDAHTLYSLKLDFLRIIFSHEHFVALNLPYGTPFMSSSTSTSPSPSVSSTTSQSSFMSFLTTKDKKLYAELSPEFRQHHYFVGLIFSDLATILDMQIPVLHSKVVNIIRNLMTSHDSDVRYAEPESKARVAALYLPLLLIVMDMLPQLYSWNNDLKSRSLLNQSTECEQTNGIHQSIAMAIAGTSMFGIKHSSSDAYRFAQQPRKCTLSNETTQNLLICFLWVIKNMAKEMLRKWWTEWSTQRLLQMLEMLNICISCFEYRGRKIMKSASQQTFNKTMDIKSRLEDVILGQGSARSELMMRKKGGPGDRYRWRKDHVLYRPNSEATDKPKPEHENDCQVEGNLATEVSFIVLDTLEQIVQVATQCDHLHSILESVLKVLLHALSRNQSTCVLQSMFAVQRSFVYKFPNLLFDEDTEQCADLCLLLLKHCCSNLGNIRSQAAASLYMLMRQNFEIGNNFTRVKMQVTMSLSSLVGTSHTFNEVALRRSLKTILMYSDEDKELQDTTFPEQVKDLVFNLHMILSDTVKMKEFQEDPEMLLDLMYRIAKGYQNSPDLRVTWLANMAQKHMEHNNHTEAGMCLVHSAALVSEYLQMLEDQQHLPLGAASFEKVTLNILEECAVSDDVLRPEEEGFCLGKDFTENGLIGLLEHAASSFQLAGMYEAMSEVYKVMIPIIEKNHDYKKLANIYSKLNEAYTRLEQLQGKRIFGTYFRVGFYGTKFGDLNGEEFIYKEPTLTKLSEIFSRLQSFYSERFGPDVVNIIKDSNHVDPNTLDPDKAYIQITYVEPYFETYEERHRKTYFERNFNLKRFVYATPFTSNGKPHGDLHEQWKRKTTLTVANHFPYVKTRIQVVDRKQIVLTPIEVAIEDIQKKTAELAHSIQQDPPDTKILQMVLQGCIGTTVNQGPMEMATVFLTPLLDENHEPTKLQNKLRLCFKDFSKKCSDALRKNKNLIGPDQRDYQRELERNYHRFTDKLTPLITIKRTDNTLKCLKS
ncbi:dedicator of cytokinesis protein 7 [Planococcus citri]|uniref:dedicator of cytokinesis protein 7 n=1 Tax=Planococcus citri TaxID=170843 RepID=UPI0031F7E60A